LSKQTVASVSFSRTDVTPPLPRWTCRSRCSKSARYAPLG
jgi:hypothetical protein